MLIQIWISSIQFSFIILQKNLRIKVYVSRKKGWVQGAHNGHGRGGREKYGIRVNSVEEVGSEYDDVGKKRVGIKGREK